MGEAYMDSIDRSLNTLSWPEHCRKCLAANDLNHATTLYCPADTGCQYHTAAASAVRPVKRSKPVEH